MSAGALQPAPGPPRVLLWVTTRRDAETSPSASLRSVGIDGTACETLAAAFGRGSHAARMRLLPTEEAVRLAGIEALVGILHAADTGLDLPTVLLTEGGQISSLASAFQAQLTNLTLLERPASVRSIVSAVQSAVRVRRRQRELALQMSRVSQLQGQLAVALTASELGTFYNQLPLGALEWDAQIKAHFWLSPDAEVDFARMMSILHPEDRERTRLAIDACVSRRAKYDVEYRTISPTGAVRWIRATGQTQHDGAGRPYVFSGTTQDITARKLLEQERDQLLVRERAARMAGERANRLKDEFLATLGHELRTPLNAIMGWAELLKVEPDDPATVREGVEVIERNVRAQSQLIDDLLDVSRIISGKVRLNVKPVRLDEVIQAALETVGPSALAKGIRLEPVVHSHAPPVSGDFGRLQQVVWNLLTNAVKFTPKGGKVQVLLEQRGSFLEVEVSDTGEGIEADYLPYVFERFSQADGSPSRQHMGLGLGLSIVKTLIEMHGGTVTVESAGKGMGSTFRLRLPVRLARVAEGGEAAAPALEAAAPRAASRPDLSGITVLVVDDEPDARGMMHRLLTGCQATSVEAANSEEALLLADRVKPNIILSDIGMPGTDGYQFIRSAREHGVTAPAVALTAFARSEDRVRSIHAGFQAHLAKPIEAAELLALVASLSGRIPRVS